MLVVRHAKVALAHSALLRTRLRTPRLSSYPACYHCSLNSVGGAVGGIKTRSARGTT